MEPNEYIEKILSDAYKREIDEQDSVFRTLAFFPTSLTVLFAAMGLLRTVMPTPAFEMYSLVMHILLILLGISVFISIIFLLKAVLLGGVRYVSEEKILSYGDQLKEFLSKSSLVESDKLNQEIIRDIRVHIIIQYSECIEINHNTNRSRTKNRNYSLMFMVFSITLAFLMAMSIFVNDSLDKITYENGSANPTSRNK